DATLLLMTLGLIAIASFGKFAGAFIGGEFGGLTRREAFALACGMNARGSTEGVVATIGLSMGAPADAALGLAARPPGQGGEGAGAGRAEQGGEGAARAGGA